MSAISKSTTKTQLIALYNDMVTERDQVHANLCKALLENDKLISENRELGHAIGVLKEEITRLREASAKSVHIHQTKAAHEQLADAIGGDSAWKIAEAFKPHLEGRRVTFSVKCTCYQLVTEDELMKKFLARLAVVLGSRAYPFQHNGKKLTLNWKK